MYIKCFICIDTFIKLIDYDFIAIDKLAALNSNIECLIPKPVAVYGFMNHSRKSLNLDHSFRNHAHFQYV
jgi:hypothetical protein